MITATELASFTGLTCSVALLFVVLARRASSERATRRLRRWARGMTALCLLVGIAAAGGLRFNPSPSMPRGFYWARPLGSAPLARGEIVCFEPSSAHAPAPLRDMLGRGLLPEGWENRALLKGVEAVAGEQVDYREDPDGAVTLLLPGREVRALPLIHETPEGDPIAVATFPSGVPEGAAWLHGDHVRSFDSRYFGPVDRRALSCRAEAIWTE